ncbi:hypothetical protein DOTSEDRAFT_70097 [Dothistroma septosporum NZE10]|uniref:J domain-containing protein n=1 Tax=Dothistroma septosporum (strain NZE10 / CBS 128990) TaxID=675120 RepID=N1PRF7_DOTSN|nr:hypothetical protein DOTSEDRAFT_70097 [Dothistroma septosporum NZE10]
MVKPDVKHNYYADLDLPTTATVDDVRKAYRKLALQYHPDRNAGKEEECVPRFQAIQAANEVLSDATTKAKYDQDRRKAGLYPTFKAAPPAPGSPYATTSAYPPPPRRTQPGAWQRPSAAAGQPTGADRFTNFPRPANAMPGKNPAADRTQQFRAWQNMNSAPTPEKPRYPNPGPAPPPRSPNPQTQPQTTARPRMSRQDTKLPSEEQIKAGFRYGAGAAPAAEKQTAWHAFQTANAGKPGVSSKRPQGRAPTTPRRPGGFDPNAPGSDERPAPSSTGHYVHRHKSEDFTSDGFPPPPPGPPPTSAPHTPTSPQNLRPFPPRQPPSRGRTPNEEVPYAEGNRVSTPYASFIGEKLQFGDGLRRSASTRDTTRLRPESNIPSSSRARSSSPPLRQTKTADDNANGHNQEFVPPASSESSNSSEASSDYPDQTESPEEKSDSSATDNRSKHTPRAPEDRPKKVPKGPSSRLNGSNLYADGTSTSVDGGHYSDSGRPPSMEQRPSSNNIFHFPVDGETLGPTAGKSRSFDNINTKFSPDGFSGTFMGTPPGAQQPDYFSAAGRRPSPGRRGQARRADRASTYDAGPTSNGSTPGGMGPPPRPDVAQTQTTPTFTPPSDVKFDEQQWKSTFRDPSWTWKPEARSDSQNGSRSKTPIRKASRLQTNDQGTATGTQEQPHIIIDEPDPPGDGAPEAAAANDADAMDIDTDPPTTSTSPNPEQVTTRETTSTKGPRYVSVEPSPWRKQQEAQQRSPSSARPARDATEPQLRTNLEDLAQVEPIAKSADGLKNLADMSSTLPFQSSAATTANAQALKPQRLMTPAVPKAPEPPTRLSKQSWHVYAVSFGTYLKHFHGFNKTMLAHFDTREKQADTRMFNGTAWLEATGDPTSHTGWGHYLKGVLEDEAVRTAWELGCERHLEAVKTFEKLRERIRKLVSQSALAEV